MRHLACAALLGGPLLMLVSITPRAEEKLDLTNERQQAFAWMTKLGYPETKDLKFVLVATGEWSTSGNKAPENQLHYGFLMEEKGTSFKCLMLNLDVQMFEKTRGNTAAYKSVSYEILDLDKETKTLLGKAQETEPGKRMSKHFGYHLSERTQLFLLAWACSRKGLDEAAAKLYDQARSPKYNRYEEDQQKPIKTLQEKVADDLGNIEILRGVEAFRDLRISRQELYSRFERMVTNFPNSSHHALAAETATLLKQMIKEDEEHASVRKNGKPFDQLTNKEQIAELIFQLRNQTSESGFFDDIFWTMSGKTNTPAHSLVDRGYDAVPQLLEFIEDQRFTRAVEYQGRWASCNKVLRVGECAQKIIESIAGVSFNKPNFAKNSRQLTGRELARAEIKAWYAELMKKGEKGFLTEATERGDHNSGEMANRLLKKYPMDALPVLIKGAKAAKDGPVRATIVDLIASCNGEDSLRFLLTEIKEGPLAQPRLTAAEALHKLGRHEGLAAMIEWWKSGVNTTQNNKERDEDPAGWYWYIARFLANCSEVEAIQGLAFDLHKHPICARLHAIAAVGGMEPGPGIQKMPAKDPIKLAAAVEALLVSALDDLEESGNCNDFSETRVCDFAADVLNHLDPKKYAFDPDAQPRARNRQLVVMKNVWRSENRLPPLPIPEPRRIPTVAVEELRPLLERYATTTGDKRQLARNEIEKLGLGALPQLLERRNQTANKSDREMWNELAKRLSCIVAEIEFGEGSVKPEAALVKRLEELKGKPFDAKTFIQTVGSTLKNPPNTTQGIRIVALRAGDGTGFSMKIDLVTNPKNAQGPPTQWGFSERVKIGKEIVRSQFGVYSDEGVVIWTKGDYPELAKVLVQATASDPDQPVEIRIYIAPQWRN